MSKTHKVIKGTKTTAVYEGSERQCAAWAELNAAKGKYSVVEIVAKAKKAGYEYAAADICSAKFSAKISNGMGVFKKEAA